LPGGSAPENVGAIDPAPQFAAACRERHPGADVREGVAEALPWADGSFDATLTRGDLGQRFRQAGLQDVVEGELEAHADYAGFDDFWEPFTFAVGPAGQYLASLPADKQARLREACKTAVPDEPFSLTARAWYARGTATA
jgi:methyltransferase family protein